MKIITILFLLFTSTAPSVVDKLNSAKRELKFCDTNKIKDWRIDDARKFVVKFENATLINKKLKSYKLSGSVSEWNDIPIEMMRIKYGDSAKEICHSIDLTQTDSLGNFEIEVSILPDKFIEFYSTGYNKIYISLDLKK